MRYLLFNKIGRRLLIATFLLIVSYFCIENYFSKTIEMYTQQKAQLYTTKSIEEAVRESIVGEDVKSIVNIIYKDEGYATSVSVDSYKVNMILANMSKSLYESIERLESDYNDELTVPLGFLLSRTIFSNVGPDINIDIKPIGSVRLNLISSIIDSGINSSLLEIYINIQVSFLVLIPMQEQEIVTVSNIPLVVEIISGDIPNYYHRGESSFGIESPFL